MAAAKQDIINALNQDLGLELGAITQYMWHHVMGVGMESPAITDTFKEISMDEMKHAEKLAERIDYLGGTPVTKPAEIKMGGDLKKMIADDLDGENLAIRTYKGHIKLCEEANDPVTRLLLENILTDEEDHAYTWETVLGS
ncbi:MAG: ferritin [Chloroflexi bacterium]|nr:ferritin [Chloroflexota bacterium]